MRLFLAALCVAFCAVAAPAAVARAETVLPVTTVWPIPYETAAALDDANASFSAAWVAGDVEALLGAYTEDAVVHPPAGGVLTSRDSIRPVWAGITNSERNGHRLEPTLRQSLSGGEVLEMGRWHTSRVVDGQSVRASGCYTVIWRNDNGHWRMRYDAWTAPNDASWACRPR